MFRDPRDMSASWKNGFAMRGGVIKGANIWKKDVLGFLRMRAWLPMKSIPMLRYEDLLLNPEKELSGACMALGLKFEKEMLNFHDTPSARANSHAAADWKNVAKPIIKDNFNKYKKTLTSDEILYIDTLCRQEMLALGYQPEYAPLEPEEFSELERELVKKEPLIYRQRYSL